MYASEQPEHVEALKLKRARGGNTSFHHVVLHYTLHWASYVIRLIWGESGSSARLI